MFDAILTYAQENQTTGTSFTEFAIYVATVVGMWKMFEKAGEPGWPAIIPFYNYYKLCEVAMGNPWYWLRLLVFVVPVVGWIAGFYFMFQICKATALAYGRPEGYAWGLLFLSPVFFCILGFGDTDYYGPMGVMDRRTAQARESKTVNFEVKKNAPEEAPQQYQDYSSQTRVDAAPAPEAKAPEETVDFVFDQPEE